MKNAFIAAVAFALVGITGSAQAATLNGLFNVTAVNVTNLTSAQSQATRANFDAARNGTLGGGSSIYASDTFTYDGDIDFETKVGTSTKIGGWLLTGGGAITDLDGGFANLQLSKGNIDNGSATTTFFLFESTFQIGKGSFDVSHDDGIAIFENGDRIGGFVGPNSVRDTLVSGFNGGKFELLYVATNSDPSILNVNADVAPVPLPAPFALLAAGLAGLGLLGRRRKTT